MKLRRASSRNAAEPQVGEVFSPSPPKLGNPASQHGWGSRCDRAFHALAFLRSGEFRSKLQRGRRAAPHGGKTMTRYLVERTFASGLDITVDAKGRQACMRVVSVNAEEGVTWVHSYVSEDCKKTFCVYDAPSPEAIRSVAQR